MTNTESALKNTKNSIKGREKKGPVLYTDRTKEIITCGSLENRTIRYLSNHTQGTSSIPETDLYDKMQDTKPKPDAEMVYNCVGPGKEMSIF